jgi:phospholipid/cholesterol/gamma-HCH transport system permease protein
VSARALLAWSQPVRDRLRQAVEDTGALVFFAGRTVAWAFRPPFRPEILLAQMAFVGVGSVFIVSLTGIFTGMVLALQGSYALHRFSAEGFVGGTVALSLARELSPVMTAIMITGRAGSAIATELGTMRVTEQIDAMDSMAVDPLQYLVVPRLLAAVVMFPVLTMLFSAVAYGGAYVMGVYVSDIPAGPFIEHTRRFVAPGDILNGLMKAVIFGAIVALITTYRGFTARGGAQGVGAGTTRAVVSSYIAILVADYAITLVTIGDLFQ